MLKTKTSRAVAGAAALAVTFTLLVGAAPARRAWRESRMLRATAEHYQVMATPGVASLQALEQFASEREAVFAKLDGKLGSRASGARIRIIFDEEFAPAAQQPGASGYEVRGTEIRVEPPGTTLTLESAADAQAILSVVWGQPASPVVARWAAIGLAGEGRGEDLGIAAARVAQKSGHQTLATLLTGPSAALTEQDHTLLGGAWMSAVAEFGGASAAHTLYSKLPAPDLLQAASLLGTTSTELERTWQMWIYAHLIGLPLPAPPGGHDHAH